MAKIAETPQDPAIEEAKQANFECENHHWVSIHQPGLPLYWIKRCSICKQYDAEDMQSQISQLINEAEKRGYNKAVKKYLGKARERSE